MHNPLKLGIMITSSIFTLVIIFAVFSVLKVNFVYTASCGCPAVVQNDDPEQEEDDDQDLDSETDTVSTTVSTPKITDETAFEEHAFSSILGSGASATVAPHSSTTPAVEQCPAVKAPKANQYLSYNPRYQAVTIEEAVSNFVDLTDESRPWEDMNNLFGQKPKFFDQKSGLPNGINLKCNSTLCSDCVKILAYKLGYDPGVEKILHDENIIARDDALKQGFKLNFGGGANGRYKPYCPLLNRTNKNYQKVKKPKMKSSELNKLLDTAKISRNIASGRSISRITRDVKSPQSRIVPLSTIGKSVEIDCKYHRGDRLDDQSKLCGLCNLCWTIRLLPEKYYPRFINEITCNKNASRCLSGHGVCQEKFRNLVTLIDTGTDPARPKWEQVDATTSVACECFVYQNSALYNIVKD